MPDAIIKNKFLKVNPPPAMISEEHNHTQRRANIPNPIAFPIPNSGKIRFRRL